jgi:hypothetical protein
LRTYLRNGCTNACKSDPRSDYKLEWLKLKQKKQEEAEKHRENMDEELLKSPGIGEKVPLVTSINSGRELADIYLKHPANESSEDSEGEEVPADQKIDGKFVFGFTLSLFYVIAVKSHVPNLYNIRRYRRE